MTSKPSPDVLARFLTGQASDEEEAEIRAWMVRDPEALMHLEGQTVQSEEFINRRDPETALTRITQMAIDAPATKLPEPIESSDRAPVIHRLRAVYYFRAAAVIAVLVVSAWLIRRLIEPATPAIQLTELSTDRGERTNTNLEDGTTVELNVASRLQFPDTFSPNRREVWLEGEAYFDVVSDPGRPFYIHTGEATITVLGTAFNVSAYAENDQIEIVVVEGRVAVLTEQDRTSATPVLSAGQKGRLSSVAGSPVFSVEQVDPEQFLGWRRGELLFQGTPLNDVARALSRWYNIEVTLEGNDIARLRLDAGFSDEPLNEVLGVIAVALDISYRSEGRHVTFYRQ